MGETSKVHAERKRLDAETISMVSSALGMGTRATSVSRTVEFELPVKLDVPHPHDASRKVRIHRVAARVSRFPTLADEDGLTVVTGYGFPLNDAGQVDRRATREQPFPLPDALAVQMLYLAELA